MGPERQPKTAIESPMQGTVMTVSVAPGDRVRAGQVVVLLESMKMLHDVRAPSAGIVHDVVVAEGATVMPGDLLCTIEGVESQDADVVEHVAVDLDAIRPDLAEVVARHEVGLDAARP